MKRNPDSDAIRNTQWVVWGAGAILTVFGWAWQGGRFALGTGLGALLAGSNFWVLARSVSRLLQGVSASWAAVAGSKFLVLLGATYLALHSPHVDPLAFTLGICALPLGIVLAGVFVARPTDSDPDHVLPSSSVKSDHA